MTTPSNDLISTLKKSDVLRDFAQAAGIAIVEVPLAEITEDGILLFQGLPGSEKGENVTSE